MNENFQPFIRKFVLVFFNDILVYNIPLQEQAHHLSTLCQAFKMLFCSIFCEPFGPYSLGIWNSHQS